MMTRLLSARAVNPAKRGTARLFMPAERAKSYAVQQINNLFLLKQYRRCKRQHPDSRTVPLH